MCCGSILINQINYQMSFRRRMHATWWGGVQHYRPTARRLWVLPVTVGVLLLNPTVQKHACWFKLKLLIICTCVCKCKWLFVFVVLRPKTCRGVTLPSTCDSWQSLPRTPSPLSQEAAGIMFMIFDICNFMALETCV